MEEERRRVSFSESKLLHELWVCNKIAGTSKAPY